MDIFRAGTSRWGSTAAFSLSRGLPRRWAYRLGEAIFARVASQPELPFTRALRANLAAVLGLNEASREIDESVRRAMRTACRSYVDFARASGAGCFAVARSCRPNPSMVAILDDALGAGKGVVLAGAHTCSFDFMMAALGQRFPDLLFLTKPDPTGSSEVMNRIRRGLGLEISPISAPALREAVVRLRQGGIVVLAADVPAPGPSGLTFFGRPCALSDGFARLALAGEAVLIVGISRRLGDGEYEGLGEPVPPPPEGLGRAEAAREWAQRALFRLEGLLRRHPEEWLMPQAIWPRPSEARAPRNRESGWGMPRTSRATRPQS